MANRAVSPARQVNFKMFPVRQSVNFVQYRPTLVAKQETKRALIVRQAGCHPQRGARNVKHVVLEHSVTVVNCAQKDTQGRELITMLRSADFASWVKRRRQLVLLRVNDGK